jgi:ribosomal protein L37AE/L43A
MIIAQTMIPEHLKHFTLCPSCGRQMRQFANYEIYECRECRLFVNEKIKESDVNNVNTSSLESAVL